MSNAPKVTQEDVEALVVSHTFTVLPDSTTTICQGTLVNGYTVLGKSACVSKDNFDVQVGEEWAKKDMLNKVWPLAGLLLAERLHQEKQSKGETWVDRLFQEHKETADRLAILKNTLQNPPPQIQEADLNLLHEQARVMGLYVEVLKLRLDRARQG